MRQESYLLKSSPIFQLAPNQEKHINLALEPACPPNNGDIIEVCIKIRIKVRCKKNKKRFTFHSCSYDCQSTSQRFVRFLRRKLQRFRSTCPKSNVTVKGSLKIRTATGKIKQKFLFKFPIEQIDAWADKLLNLENIAKGY